MKMVIQSIDDGRLLMENGAKSNANMYGLIIDWLFHTVHIFPNTTRLISTSKFVQASARSNISSNMFSRAVIAQLQYWKMKPMKFKSILMHIISLHLKQSGIFLVSNYITDSRRFNDYKFIFQISKLLLLTMIQTLPHSYKMTVSGRVH